MLTTQRQNEQKDNREALLTVLLSVRFLAMQGLPFRGNESQEGNLLLKLRVSEQPKLGQWLKAGTYVT